MNKLYSQCVNGKQLIDKNHNQGSKSNCVAYYQAYQNPGPQTWLLGPRENYKASKKGITVQSTEGFGAQYSHRANVFAYCVSTGNCCYEHTPFSRVCHGQNGPELQQFTGMGSTCIGPESVTISTENAGNAAAYKKPAQYFTDEVITKLREMYYSTSKPKPFTCDYAIHVRRGDVTKAHKEAHVRWVDDGFYTKLISDIKESNPTASVCVFSEGKERDFAAFKDAGAEMHLNKDLRTTFHTMVSSPNLTIARSSLSWMAGVLNDGNVTSIGGPIPKLKHWSERIPN